MFTLTQNIRDRGMVAMQRRTDRRARRRAKHPGPSGSPRQKIYKNIFHQNILPPESPNVRILIIFLNPDTCISSATLFSWEILLVVRSRKNDFLRRKWSWKHRTPWVYSVPGQSCFCFWSPSSVVASRPVSSCPSCLESPHVNLINHS